MPNMVCSIACRSALLAEHDETLGAIVTHVLVHEIGHHFGLSTPTWKRSRPAWSKDDQHILFASCERVPATRSLPPLSLIDHLKFASARTASLNAVFSSGATARQNDLQRRVLMPVAVYETIFNYWM